MAVAHDALLARLGPRTLAGSPIEPRSGFGAMGRPILAESIFWEGPLPFSDDILAEQCVIFRVACRNGEAEDAGCDAVFCAHAENDTLAIVYVTLQ